MYLKVVIEDTKFAQEKFKKNTFAALFQHVPRQKSRHLLDTSQQKLKLTVSSIAARQIDIWFSIEVSIPPQQIELCKTAKISNAKKPITYSFKGRIEICLNQYLKDIISHLLQGFSKRETLCLCSQGFVTKFSLFHQIKEFLLYFLYAFGFCNQVNSLAPTLKIFLVFLCKAIANQLQQSKGCCGVSHVLEIMQRSQSQTRIHAKDQSQTRIHAKDQSQIRGLCIKGKKATTRSSPIVYWSKGSTIIWYFGIGQGSWKDFLYL